MKVVVRRKSWWEYPHFLIALDQWDDYNDRMQAMEDNGTRKRNCRLGMEAFLKERGFGYIPRTTFHGYARLDGERRAIDRSKQFNKRKKRRPRRRPPAKPLDPLDEVPAWRPTTYKRPQPACCEFVPNGRPMPMSRAQAEGYSSAFKTVEKRLEKECENTFGVHCVNYIPPSLTEKDTPDTMHITNSRRQQIRNELYNYQSYQARCAWWNFGWNEVDMVGRHIVSSRFMLRRLKYYIEHQGVQMEGILRPNVIDYIDSQMEVEQFKYLLKYVGK